MPLHKNKISCLIIARNEEKDILRCIKSVKNTVDEILVVHDGKCEDDTLLIAKNNGCKTVIQNRLGDSMYHLPFALREARYDWILKIDADEELSSAASKVIEYLKSSFHNAKGYLFFWPDVFDKNINVKHAAHRKLIYFNKKYTSVVGIPHANIQVEGKLFSIDEPLYHHIKSKNNFFSYLKYQIRKDFYWGKQLSTKIKNGFQPDVYTGAFCVNQNNLLYKFFLEKKYPLIFIFIIPVISLILCLSKTKNVLSDIRLFFSCFRVPVFHFSFMFHNIFNRKIV